MRVYVECAERLKKLEHFLQPLAKHECHLGVALVFEFQQMGVPGRPRHQARKVAIEGVDQGVIYVEDDIKSWRKALLNQSAEGVRAPVHHREVRGTLRN